MLLTGCVSRRPDRHVPPFARVPYEPFARDAAVAIALREWRAFGSLVDDSLPDREHPVVPDVKPEREQGLWQRIGEYWWLGLDAGSPESGWTDATTRTAASSRRPTTAASRGPPRSCRT